MFVMRQREVVDPNNIKIDLRVGAVSLQTGEYKQYKPADPGFKKAVLASTAIPIVWAPVDISPDETNLVDGGVRNVSPLGDVLDADPDEVVIINCSPRTPPQLHAPLKNALDIGRHSLEIAMNEIFITDMQEFLRINRLVQEAAKAGVTLHNKDGKPYKYYDCKLIEPGEPLNDTLDFSREALDGSMEAGLAKAKEVLG